MAGPSAGVVDRPVGLPLGVEQHLAVAVAVAVDEQRAATRLVDPADEEELVEVDLPGLGAAGHPEAVAEEGRRLVPALEVRLRSGPPQLHDVARGQPVGHGGRHAVGEVPR